MSPEEPVEVDPEVLADPLDDKASQATATEVEAEVVVPAGDRALAPVDPFRRYMAEVRRYPPLSREEEAELARRYRDTGDRDALFRLVTANLMLVVRVALSFRRAARNLLDLIQEGNLGLMQAIERFDPELGNRLPTYAAWWIRAYMVKYLLDNVRMVRVGTTNARRKLLRNLNRERRRLEEQGFEVGPKLLAEHFGVSEEDVRD
jgi:RNA polymerase sigma-32 factor